MKQESETQESKTQGFNREEVKLLLGALEAKARQARYRLKEIEETCQELNEMVINRAG